MNPTTVMTDMGSRAVSDTAVSSAIIARTPQGKFAGKYCVNIVESNYETLRLNLPYTKC